MDRATANKLYRNHAGAMAYGEVSENGDRKIGTAFHVGSGVFLTARHVVERTKIISIHPTEYLLLPPEEADPELSSEQIKQGFRRYTPVFQEALKLADGPFYHSNQNVDVASFRVESVHPSMPIVKLGTHLDDWVRDRDWILTEAIILGYPRIPMTTAPCLVAARAELNAIVQFYNTKNIHFIVSAIPRLRTY
jgi:hypothetical protein